MRLTKIQKKLKELQIGFTYEEIRDGFGAIDIQCIMSNGQIMIYPIFEHSTNNNYPEGILYPGSGAIHNTQKEICEWLEKNQDRFVKVENK